MTKRLISILLAAVLALGLLTACGGKKALTPDDAKKLVLKDLDIRESDADSFDYHVTTVDGKVCYAMFISVGDHHWEYTIVGATGEVLDKTQAEHGHSH